MINKMKYRKVNNKKVLHKVKKQWIVVGTAALALLAAGAAPEAVHADTTNTNVSSNNSSSDTTTQNSAGSNSGSATTGSASASGDSQSTESGSQTATETSSDSKSTTSSTTASTTSSSQSASTTSSNTSSTTSGTSASSTSANQVANVTASAARPTGSTASNVSLVSSAPSASNTLNSSTFYSASGSSVTVGFGVVGDNSAAYHAAMGVTDNSSASTLVVYNNSNSVSPITGITNLVQHTLVNGSETSAAASVSEYAKINYSVSLSGSNVTAISINAYGPLINANNNYFFNGDKVWWTYDVQPNSSFSGTPHLQYSTPVYLNQPQPTKINYVDKGGSAIASAAYVSADNAYPGVSYAVTIAAPSGYTYSSVANTVGGLTSVSGNTLTNSSLVFTNYNDPSITVYYNKSVSPSSAATTVYSGGDTNFPANLNKSDVAKTFTRQINYVDASGKQVASPVLQLVTYTRSATYDNTTNSVTSYSDWQASGAASFAAATSPSVSGLTPSQSSVDSQAVPVDYGYAQSTITVTYNSNGTSTSSNASSSANGSSSASANSSASASSSVNSSSAAANASYAVYGYTSTNLPAGLNASNLSQTFYKPFSFYNNAGQILKTVTVPVNYHRYAVYANGAFKGYALDRSGVANANTAVDTTGNNSSEWFTDGNSVNQNTLSNAFGSDYSFDVLNSWPSIVNDLNNNTNSLFAYKSAIHGNDSVTSSSASSATSSASSSASSASSSTSSSASASSSASSSAGASSATSSAASTESSATTSSADTSDATSDVDSTSDATSDTTNGGDDDTSTTTDDSGDTSDTTNGGNTSIKGAKNSFGSNGSDETSSTSSTKSTSTDGVTSTNGSKTTTGKNGSKLPQTGENNEVEAEVLLGLIMISFAGIFGGLYRRKRNN